MPCDSSYMNPTGREQEVGLVRSPLDELDGKEFDHARSAHHPLVYCQGPDQERDDAWVADLCSRCAALGDGIRKHSLELQMWWRDHQKEDGERIRRQQDSIDALTRKIHGLQEERLKLQLQLAKDLEAMPDA